MAIPCAYYILLLNSGYVLLLKFQMMVITNDFNQKITKQAGKGLSKCAHFHAFSCILKMCTFSRKCMHFENVHIFTEMRTFSCIFIENAKNKVSKICQCKAFSGRSRISHKGGVDLVGRGSTPEAVTFRNFVCWNKRIWTLSGTCAKHAPRSANGIE